MSKTKLHITGTISAAALILILNCFTVVEDGTSKVGKFLGTINESTYTGGLHFINPMTDFDTWDIKEQVLTQKIIIPS